MCSKKKKIVTNLSLPEISKSTRNPEMMNELLDLLYDVWRKQPDTRFHQLIHNLAWEYNHSTGRGRKRTIWEESNEYAMFSDIVIDLYNVEDEDFIAWLKARK